MESLVKLYLEKAENELVLAESLFKISSNNILKEKLEVSSDNTFYSAVITHSYYCIFNSAKAYIISKGVKVSEQGQHQAVYHGFRRFVLQGVADKELLNIYEDLRMKAEALLDIFRNEKEKRTTFTYKTSAQANIEPAKESMDNAGKFFKNINYIIKQND
jgi:uncharacterized protein (UPF0332 family)